MISATSFTLVGVVNKFITVLLNVIMWNKHSSSVGVLAVCGCLVAGVFYEQAPLRSDVHKGDLVVPSALAEKSDSEEQDRLIEVASVPTALKNTVRILFFSWSHVILPAVIIFIFY